MANGIKIDEQDFERLSNSEQNTILFKNTEQILEHISATKKSCDKRFKRLENRSLVDKGVAGITGFFGGFMAVISKSFFFKG